MSSSWISNWSPEDPVFWNTKGKKRAWTTLTITTASLTLSFSTWFLFSALVTRLPGIGFSFSTNQLFWLAAMPGLAGGTLRLIHMFLIPLYGTRHTLTISTLIKLIPVIGLGMAVMNPGTPFWVFLVLALATGFGGGDFSSFMPSTSLFFPRRMIGTALGIQAGIGNFGVSLAQFLTPVLIGVATLGPPQNLLKIDIPGATQNWEALSYEDKISRIGSLSSEESLLLINLKPKIGDSVPQNPNQVLAETESKSIWKSISKQPIAVQAQITEKLVPQAKKQQLVYLQSASFWYAPFLIILGILCWLFLRSIPMAASFAQQLDIFKDKHTWFCTITYFLTFGTFSGLSAAFPLMIKSLYGGFPNAPDPLAYAFYGPLIGSASRVLFGFVADRTGGAILTSLTGIGLLTGTLLLVFLGLLSPTSLDQFPVFTAIILSMFFFAGIGNAATFRQYPVIFSHNPRQAAGVIGFTAAIAAYGPFIFSALIGTAIQSAGNPGPFFLGLAAFLATATLINWYYYQRKGCERPS